MREISDFENLVYRATKKIPKGRVSTYGEIARYIAREKSYRAVGNALNKNPFAPQVPCHRVVSSSGALGGFAFGLEKKKALLKKEGVEIKEEKVLNFKKQVFIFKDKI